MKMFNNVTEASCAIVDGKELVSYGTLREAGVLDSYYRAAAGWSEDFDTGFDLVWTVLEDVSINGVEYAKGAEIEWCK